MASLNKVVLLGNLTRDPNLRYTPNSTAVVSFGLAVNRRYRQDEAWREEVCYVDIVTFGRQAETVVEYLSKARGSRGPTREADQTTRPDVPSRPGIPPPNAPPMGGGSELDEGLPPTDDDIPFVRSDLHNGSRRDRWEPVA